MEFHIARKTRERYEFAESLFSYNGNVVLANMPACREFAHRMNRVRDVEKHPELAVHAGELYAMGLIDEASHVLMARYREQFDPQVMTAALDWFSAQVGTEHLEKMLLAFVEEFPGLKVMRGEEAAAQWLAGSTGGMAHRAAALEEMLLLWTANRNEAFKPFEELFSDRSLAEKTVYRQVTAQMPAYFASRPLIPVSQAKPMSLIDLLRTPALRSPRSLREQLEIIRMLWAPLIGDSLDRLLELAGEILREEELAIWAQFNPPGRRAGAQQWPSPPGGAEVPVFSPYEYERFSADTAWMPSAVLMAKSTYVWLAQLSRQYGRHIGRLDEIPDAELARLARVRHQFAVADRGVGAQPGVEDDQATLRQPRRRGVGLFAVRLHHCAGFGRGTGLCEPAGSRLPSWHPAGQRHGPEPHGHRFAMGDRAPGVVHVAGRVAVPGVQLQRPRSVA